MALPSPLNKIKEEFGNSDEASRQAVIDAHGGKKGVVQAGHIWWEHHWAAGDDPAVFYASAVDVGVRIGRKIGGEGK